MPSSSEENVKKLLKEMDGKCPWCLEVFRAADWTERELQLRVHCLSAHPLMLMARTSFEFGVSEEERDEQPSLG